MKSVSEWLGFIASELSFLDSPRREAELLIMNYLERDQLWLITSQNFLIEDDEKLTFWISRRKNHEPLEYITNRVSFYSQTFFIKEGALIPRPETELLIDFVIEKIDKNFSGTFVEVGVGSGIISILLAQKFQHAKIIAVDISDDALKVAKKNIENFHLLDRIELRNSDLLQNVNEKIDILISNPPYISDTTLLEKNLFFEPQNALYGGYEGDEIIKKLLDECLNRDIKYFFCEMGYDQKDKVTRYLNNCEIVEFYKDYSHFDRGFMLRLHND